MHCLTHHLLCNERPKRGGVTRGNGAMRGGGAHRWELDERRRQMGGGDLMRGNATTRRTRCLEKSNTRVHWRRIMREAMC